MSEFNELKRKLAQNEADKKVAEQAQKEKAAKQAEQRQKEDAARAHFKASIEPMILEVLANLFYTLWPARKISAYGTSYVISKGNKWLLLNSIYQGLGVGLYSENKLEVGLIRQDRPIGREKYSDSYSFSGETIKINISRAELVEALNTMVLNHSEDFK